MTYLNTIVGIASRFQRSVNITAELQNNSQSQEGFQLLPSNVRVLANLASHLKETNQRAFTITGVYGSGKSSLGLFLCDLVGRERKLKALAKKKLEAFERGSFIYEMLARPTRRVVVLNGRSGSLEEDINEALFADTKVLGLKENLKIHPEGVETSTLLMIDELGRYMAEGQSDNCAVLQDFAEYINTGKTNIVFVGILHQNFAAYATNQTEREEWAKVQGRFMDLPLISYPEETLRMLALAVTQQCADTPSKGISEKAIRHVIDYLSKTSRVDQHNYVESFRESWPLNPVVSLLLGPIARRGFWQNNRSIFNFLTSQEPDGFQDFLSKTPVDSEELYSPYHLWDYLYSNFSHLIASDSNESHRWAVAETCVEKTKNKGTENHIRLIESIAIITLFKAGSGLEANELVLRASLPTLGEKNLNELLADLLAWKIIIERRQQQSYTLYDGSDFDIAEEKEKIGEIEVDPLSLNNVAAFAPIVARRHYAETGTLRWFKMEMVNEDRLEAALKIEFPQAAGRIFLFLETFEGQKEKTAFIEKLSSRHKQLNNPLVVFGVTENAKRISDISKDFLLLQKLYQDPRLEGDRVARQELETRIEGTRVALQEEIDRAFLGIEWVLPKGQVKRTENYQQLNRIISDLCGDAYSVCPYLNNELINRQNISGNIRSAQKKLAHAMVERASQERLGLEGYPPEAMIYLTLFQANQLHREVSKGQYDFVIPERATNNTRRFVKLWLETQKVLAKEESMGLEELYTLWDKPPFGIKAALKPLLLLYFFLAKKEVLSFYQDGIYEPILSPEIIDLMLISPKHLQVRYHKLSASDNELSEKLYQRLKDFDGLLSKKDPLSVARSLVKIILTLPKWAQITTRPSEMTKRFREAVLRAHDPYALIFTDLPEVFKTKDPTEIVLKTTEAIKELQALNPVMLEEVKKCLLKAIDSNGDPKELRDRANKIKEVTSQLQLKRFITNISTYQGTALDVERVLGLASGKLLGKWTDSDITNAKVQIAEYAFSFRHLEGIANLGEETNGRRLFGLVMAGSEGRGDLIVDIPKVLPNEARSAQARIAEILKDLPHDLAVAALIESGINLLDKKNE